MENKIIKNAMMLCVSHKNWNFPKHILMETDSKNGERLDDIAKRAFEKYKASQDNGNELQLLDYVYYGPVEIYES